MRNDAEIERRLDDFDPGVRREALRELARRRPRRPPPGVNVNLHMHSFFSYNAEGMSPSHLAWKAAGAGLYAAGLCDFDVLDGLEEFLEAGLVLGLRATVNLETRAFFPEYGSVDINSPGEPGVAYVMGAGFTSRPPPGTAAATGLEFYRDRAHARNRELTARINARLPEIAIDYEKEVIPLTPAGCPTERHIVSAYVARAAARFPEPEARASFWSGPARRPAAAIVPLLADRTAMEELARTALAKRGGIGYETPTAATFPPIGDFIRWARSGAAIPLATWLDGTSPGESDPETMLALLCDRGVAGANIIPDRNWNVADPETAAVKRRNLARFVRACERLRLPINIGTELNKAGLPFVDDLAVAELARYRAVFQRGARIMVGHTILCRYAGFSYVGEEAEVEFGNRGAEKNRVFERVGALPPVDLGLDERLRGLERGRALDFIRDAATAGHWPAPGGAGGGGSKT